MPILQYFGQFFPHASLLLTLEAPGVASTSSSAFSHHQATFQQGIGFVWLAALSASKMGQKNDPEAVVDSHLRVYGIRGLRVVDAGVMPTITSGNTNSPTLMIAEKAARWILQDN